MSRTRFVRAIARLRTLAWAVVLAVATFCAGAFAVDAAPMGKIQGKIVGTDNGEPIGFADVLLIPADTTLRKVGGLTNADGTFLLEAAPGRYTLQFRALSYATKRIEGIELEAGELLPFSTGLTPEAIQQEEVVVEAKARQNTESALLNARKKASSVSDAVSAEQVRRSPDKDAAEVLRRVTGLSVSDGKYVFVRGLGERYSSTEVDGVRLVSPEQNKRVVPLDLVPANLLDNIVVQKTYTADRPGEFGGGDVQVRTKDFPGRRTFSFSVSQGFNEGATFEERRTYASGRSDVLGFGSDDRGMPDAVAHVSLPRWTAATRPMLSELGKSFSNVWSATASNTIPNGSYSANYGDEFKLFGRALGLVQSWSLARSFDKQDEEQRFFINTRDTLYDYDVTRWTESVQLGGLSAMSYRLSPRHSLHLRGIYSNNADDEVRQYVGEDHNSTDGSGGWAAHRNTRLQYVQRTVLSGVAEGRHEFSRLLGLGLDWKLGRSSARRQQPDQREYQYDRAYYFEGDTAHWQLASRGMREFGDMRDQGWGATITGTLPYRVGRLGNGKLVIGYDRQIKERTNFYRRLYLQPNRAMNRELPPESLFAEPGFDGSSTSGYVEDKTLNDPISGLDNYDADQKVSAGFLSLDLPLGRRARANLGVRVETGLQNVRSYALFEPTVTLAEGRIDKQDWLPSGSVTWGVTDAINVRLAASRTLSRPDLNELSPSPFLEYAGGFLVRGNPDLQRAMLDNYDVRVEAFPALGEVLAAGFFYKKLHEPIEQTIVAGSPYLLVPQNSDEGRNLGVELEARTGLARFWKGLNGFSVNANASFISSEVDLKQSVSMLGSDTHPLQGQADYLFNGALSYTTPAGADVSLLLNATGKRLRTVAVEPLPDIYQQPFATLDATVNFSLLKVYRVKAAAKNLLDPELQSLQGDLQAASYRTGRSYSVAVTYGL
jgi:outer membrane receptor protein involved in Fe transport